MVRIYIQILQIPFEFFEFTFECFKSLLNNYNLHLNPPYPFRIVRIRIRMFRISFEGLKFAFECFKFGSNG